MTRRLALSYAVGGIFALVGAYAMFSNGNFGQWKSAAIWFVGGVVLHDFVLTPVVLVVGLVLSRLVPAPYRGFVQAALYISGAVTLASILLVLGPGRDPNIASQQPLPYGRNLLLTLGAVWLVAAVLATRRAFAGRRPAPLTAQLRPDA